MQIVIPRHGQNVCSSCINPKSFAWNYESEVLCLKLKKKDNKKNSKRIGKSVLPIYTATTKAIINRIFAINTTKYNYYEISPTNKPLTLWWCIPCTAAWRRVPCTAQLCAARDTLLRSCCIARVPRCQNWLFWFWKLLHNVMQYSAEGRKTTIFAHKLRRQNHILKADMEIIIIIIIWFNLI